ncbi:MAG: hypothetical protein WBE13_19795 [Candidatus Acidiferrum sp.]
MYIVFKQLENGEFAHVASRDDFEQASQLAHGLNAEWPGKYEVRDSSSGVVSYIFSARRNVETEIGVNQLGGPHVSTHNFS